MRDLPNHGRPPDSRWPKLPSFSDTDKASLLSLTQSADASPSLKNAYEGVLAVWDAAEVGPSFSVFKSSLLTFSSYVSSQRVRSNRSNAKALALRCRDILDVFADSISDPADIPPYIGRSVEEFTEVMLDSIQERQWFKFKVSTHRSQLRVFHRYLDKIYRDILAVVNPPNRTTQSKSRRYRFKFTVWSSKRPKFSSLSDIAKTSLRVLLESADACPPLKSACGGVLARVKGSRSDAEALALRCTDILCIVADCIPDPAEISPIMGAALERFTCIVTDVQAALDQIQHQSWNRRLVNLNRHENDLAALHRRLDDAQHDLMIAAALRTQADTKHVHKNLQTVN
ncbi:hypothetical protein H0H92_007956 [Tricholoma furcatifolium]|nr:hypothetical protein H0H92_007956 [Tricholoma furcatifolium]